MNKHMGMFSIVLLLALSASYYWGCNKTDQPFGVYAPQGLDVPSATPTPANGTFNCYVYDGSPKMGVTVNLVDPSGNTIGSEATDQYGNAPFSPNPLVIGNYSANVPTQGRYGYSSLPITISSLSQSAVSVQFWAGNQALSIISGAPASFGTGTGAFQMSISYFQPGTLDVPVSIVHNALASAWTASPTTFVMNMAIPSLAVTVNKVSCAVLNQPITWTAMDFLGNAYGPFAQTTISRNFPVNVSLSATTANTACIGGHQGQYRTTLALSSPNDCGLSWYVSGLYKGTVVNSAATISSYLPNSGSVTTGMYATGAATTCTLPPPGATSSVTISSPLGTAIGTGFSGTVINATF